MKNTLRRQSAGDRQRTAVGERKAVSPRSDGRIVRPTLGNAAGRRPLPSATWKSRRGAGH